MAPFYRSGSAASRLKPLQGGSLLFTTKFPEIPSTQTKAFSWYSKLTMSYCPTITLDSSIFRLSSVL